MSRISKLCGSCAAALILALGTLGLVSTAGAADDHNSSRSNKSGSADDAQFEELQSRLDSRIDTLQGKVEALRSVLAAIQQQAAEAEALQAEIESISAEAIELTGQLTAQRGEMMQMNMQFLSEGLQVFDDQIASLLDAEVVAAVHAVLEKQIQQFTVSGVLEDQNQNPLGDRMGGLEGKIGELKAAIEAALQETGSLDTVIKASWNLKENVK